MGELFWIFMLVISLVLIFSLLMRGWVSWGWNFLIIIIVIYAGLFKLTGTPRDVWLFSLIENVHGDVQVLYHTTVPQQSIYLVLRQQRSQQPYYLQMAWTKELQEELDSAEMRAREEHAPLMVNIDQLSKGQPPVKKQIAEDQDQSTARGTADGNNKTGGQKDGGESMFYPKSVAADPLKLPVHNEIKIQTKGNQ